ncbi:MAG: hypothetical protein AAF974_09315 [Cyanobacteria bacterium P01_E01_bin.34]
MALAKALKTLLQWMCHDVFELAEPSLEVRQEFYDLIIVNGLKKLECKYQPVIRILRKALRNQRADLLAFACILDRKLESIALSFACRCRLSKRSICCYVNSRVPIPTGSAGIICTPSSPVSFI